MTCSKHLLSMHATYPTHFIFLAFILTPWSRVLQNLIVAQLVKKSVTLYGTQRSITVKITVSWVVTPCSFVNRYKRFGGINCLRRQGVRLRPSWDMTPFSFVDRYQVSEDSPVSISSVLELQSICCPLQFYKEPATGISSESALTGPTL
jgi:hypothetical protein